MYMYLQYMHDVTYYTNLSRAMSPANHELRDMQDANIHEQYVCPAYTSLQNIHVLYSIS
jgi:hypothetical protein